VRQVGLTHRGGERVELAIEFLQSVPPVPSKTVRSRLTGELVDAPGSVTYGVLLHNNGTAVSLTSPINGAPWKAQSFGDTHPILVSVETTGRALKLLVDLSGQDELLGTGPFMPQVSVVSSGVGEMNPLAVAGMTHVTFEGQDCDWDTPPPKAAEQTTPRMSTAPQLVPPTTAMQPTTSVAAPSGRLPTIVDYIRQNGIVESPVKHGDPGSPTINLPVPPGWKGADSRTPNWAYGAILLSDPSVADDPPTVIALVSKLSGNVHPAEILMYAPNEIRNLTGYVGAQQGTSSRLSGFDAVQIGGTYMKNGVKRAIAQKTVVIPGANGLYVLQLNADGTEDQTGALIDATQVIDEQTKITP
jgi:probable lipoprotein LpqN